MKRVLFQWRGHRIYAYPAMLYAGVTCGVLAGTYEAEVCGLNSVRANAALLLLSAAALAGARLLFVAANWSSYRREPRAILRRSEGGYALYGGLLLALAVSAMLLPVLRVAFAKFWDTAVITILIGMIFAKIGCFLNGCCAGRPTRGKLGMNLPDARGVWRRRIPAQLGEAGFAAVLLSGVIILWRRRPPDGAVFLAATAAYAVGRWALESAREGVGGLARITLARVISAGLAMVSLVALLWKR